MVINHLQAGMILQVGNDGGVVPLGGGLRWGLGLRLP